MADTPFVWFLTEKTTALYIWSISGDGILCQRFVASFSSPHKSVIEFPHLALLSGEYKISSGIWDDCARRFIWLRNNSYDIQMVFDRKDHGIVYLEHKWTVSQQSDN